MSEIIENLSVYKITVLYIKKHFHRQNIQVKKSISELIGKTEGNRYVCVMTLPVVGLCCPPLILLNPLRLISLAQHWDNVVPVTRVLWEIGQLYWSVFVRWSNVLLWTSVFCRRAVAPRPGLPSPFQQTRDVYPMLVQCWISIGWTSRVCWELCDPGSGNYVSAWISIASRVMSICGFILWQEMSSCTEYNTRLL